MHSSQLSLSSLLLSILLLIHSTTTTANPAPVPQDSTSTMTAISQIPDGQVQAPTDSSTDSSLWPSSSSASSYENPFTIYTTQTNSLGVITGMPSVWTSQPSAVTSQPASPTLPSYSGYVYANTTTGAGVSTSPASASGSTVASTLTSTASVSGTTLATSTVVASESGATNASPTLAQATGGAVSNQVAGAGIGLVVLGLGFSLL
ncbi:hypothetical protein PV05_07965 [Exophiala xenobiotica]|uniref:Uncharacterized protein n=1 Tax=Exophiala xenobiotica TaxID=348802 RepID=A0A0D2EWX2_9EURO|nr:uncharacterized protein PV05_07965 [Exophiala xenobiotica]KIW52319.1 hypothetical protein PV05_07965 [Exophiala xenobiotica]